MPDPTREQLRSRRKHPVQARTIPNDSTARERRQAAARAEYYEANRVLPLTRGDCRFGPRPCPFVSCKHHLCLDVSPKTGSIKLNFPDLEAWEMRDSCVLDVADRGESTLEDVGELINVTREAVRQIEAKALGKLRKWLETSAEVAEWASEKGGE